MKSLRVLNLNGSKLDSLNNIPAMPCLEELNLDGNAITSLEELPKIGHLSKLKKLSMTGSPLAEEKGDELKKEILIALMDKMKYLKELNGEPFDDELMNDAKATK